MISERATLIRLIALCLALVPLPVAFGYSETDLATLKETGSCAGCDLSGADLYEMDLFKADLLGADLREADLTAADLTLVDLRGADLRGAVLDETNLSGANLANALLDKGALAGAVFDSERTRTGLGFKDLKLGMNVMDLEQYCSIGPVLRKYTYSEAKLGSTLNQVEGTCFDNADMPFTFKFSGGGTTGVLNFLQVGLAPYTEENHRKFIDLLENKYEPARSYSAKDVEAFNMDRSRKNQSLNTLFANGQVTLSVVSRGTGLQLLLSYRTKENGERFLADKGGPAPVDLAHLPPITIDLYKLVGNYSLKGIGARGTSTNHGRIDTAYLEIDAFENELAGELAISGTGMSGRFRIIGIEKISGNRLTVQLEPVEGSIPDGRPLRMSLEFAEDGDNFTGRWTNWFRLQNAKSRRPDDFKGVRSQSFWQTAMSHNRIDMYQAYLRLHPGGIYTAVARSRITELGGTLVAPSAPTVSPDTPATITTAVDPLVGIWVRTGSDIAWTNECWLLVGQTEDGVLIGKAQDSTRKHRGNFSDEGKNIHLQDGYAFGLKEISFERQSKMNYLWSSKANPFKSLTSIDPAMTGRISIQLNEQGPDYLASKGLLCRKRQSQSPARFRRLTIAEALELTLHPDLLKDFPSPFATEGQQVASVPKATAATPATPSAATVTTQTTGAPEDASDANRR